MNSRDAAYDDEQLRRAIEASKEEVTQDGAESITRRTKRGRSNSEEFVILCLTTPKYVGPWLTIIFPQQQRRYQEATHKLPKPFAAAKTDRRHQS